jgi:hypothetical protein
MGVTQAPSSKAEKHYMKIENTDMERKRFDLSSSTVIETTSTQALKQNQ